MSKINIDRIVKDIKTRSTSLTPIIEAVCNSMDALNNRENGIIDIIVKRESQEALEFDSSKTLADIVAVDIYDNGIGFTDQNRESFDTYKSGYKANNGGKGFGRFMYLKYFNTVSVESVFDTGHGYMKRSFSFGHKDEIIENENLEKCDSMTSWSVVHLSSIKAKDLDKNIEVIARKLVERLLVFFATGNDHTPVITIKEEDGSNAIILNDYINNGSNIVQIGEEKDITITSRQKSFVFSMKVYKIYYSTLVNRICLTAHKREVSETSLHNYVPEFKENMVEYLDNGTSKNYSIKVYVQGKYLDDNVTTERDAFNFGKEDDTIYDLSERCILKEIAVNTKQYFESDIQQRYETKKRNIEHYVFSEAPWNKTMLSEIDMDAIPVGISDFDLEMIFQKIKFEKELAARIAIKDILTKEDSTDPIEEDIQQIMAIVTETQKNDLVHYVCQRKKVIDLFDELRRRTEVGKPHKESELHNLIFPMIKSDREVEYESNNLWLLDERFNFTQYIASDKVISKVDHKEPDLALFYEQGLFYRNGENVITSPIAIVEFKRPKRTNYPDDENPITQALRYAGKILAGKYEMPDGVEKVDVDANKTPVYVYIICDIVDKIQEFARFANLSITPDGEGYFGYNPDYNAYIEMKSFKKVISDAKMRNQIFFKKLGLL